MIRRMYRVNAMLLAALLGCVVSSCALSDPHAPPNVTESVVARRAAKRPHRRHSPPRRRQARRRRQLRLPQPPDSRDAQQWLQAARSAPRLTKASAQESAPRPSA